MDEKEKEGEKGTKMKRRKKGMRRKEKGEEEEGHEKTKQEGDVCEKETNKNKRK